jgi:hypothetical protein
MVTPKQGVQAKVVDATARLYASFSPEELADETRRYMVERAKLIEMFCYKSSYSDEEIEEMIRVVEAQD